VLDCPSSHRDVSEASTFRGDITARPLDNAAQHAAPSCASNRTIKLTRKSLSKLVGTNLDIDLIAQRSTVTTRCERITFVTFVSM